MWCGRRYLSGRDSFAPLLAVGDYLQALAIFRFSTEFVRGPQTMMQRLGGRFAVHQQSSQLPLFLGPRIPKPTF